MTINANLEVALQFMRAAILIITVPLALFLTLAFVGVSYATTEVTAPLLVIQAIFYLVITFGCLAYGVWGRLPWLRWLLTGVAVLPPASFFLMMGI